MSHRNRRRLGSEVLERREVFSVSPLGMAGDLLPSEPPAVSSYSVSGIRETETVNRSQGDTTLGDIVCLRPMDVDAVMQSQHVPG